MTKKVLQVAFTLLFCSCLWAESGQQVAARMEEDRIVVEVGGSVFTEYLFGDEHKYPFFYPVVGPASGKSVTTWDQNPFPHHSSLYVSLDSVSSEGVQRGNYWQPRNRLDTGQIFSRNPRVVEASGERVVLKDYTEWIVPGAGVHQISGRHKTTIWAPSPSIRIMDFEIEIEAMLDLRIGQTGHSFFSARMRPELAVGCTQRGAAYADRGTGTIVDSKDNRDESGTFRKDSSWCAYYGKQADAIEGLALMQHPQNTLSGRWFTRNYGFMSPSPFAHDGAVEMSAGTKFNFAYRVVVFEGDHEQADIEGWYEDFAGESN